MPAENPFPYAMAIASIIVGVTVGLGSAFLSHRSSKRANETALTIALHQIDSQYRLQSRQMEVARLTAAYSSVISVLSEARRWVGSVYVQDENRLFGAVDMPDLVSATVADGALQLGWSVRMTDLFDEWVEALRNFERASAWLSQVFSGHVDPRKTQGATLEDAKRFHTEVRERVLAADTDLRRQMWSEIQAVEAIPKTA